MRVLLSDSRRAHNSGKKTFYLLDELFGRLIIVNCLHELENASLILVILVTYILLVWGKRIFGENDVQGLWIFQGFLIKVDFPLSTNCWSTRQDGLRGF